MSVHTTRASHTLVMVSRAAMRDERLSFAARGLIALVASLEPGETIESWFPQHESVEELIRYHYASFDANGVLTISDLPGGAS